MDECFFWYRPTRVVPDKRPLNGCVCVCVCVILRQYWILNNAFLLLLLLVLHPFNGFFSRTAWVSRYQKSKTRLYLNEARDDAVLGCSGISWTICKQSAPCSRQITTPAPHHSKLFTGQMLFLTPSQQCQSTEDWRHKQCILKYLIFCPHIL